MAKENIELHIIHNPKLITEDNVFAVAMIEKLHELKML